MRPVIVADHNIPFVAEMLSGIGDLRVVDGHAMSLDVVRGADILLVRSVTKVDRTLLEGSHVRFVGTATIGHDHVDVTYLGDHAITFASAPGSNANSVSEYVIAALLEVAGQRGFTLAGKRLGVVGVGNVGSRVVKKAEALGMHVLRNDPPLRRASGDPGYLSLDDLMEADIVTLHVPLTTAGTDSTQHLFGKERLGRMRRGSILLNTSRGAVVDGPALDDAMHSGHIAGAVLDVWEGEPRIDTTLLARVAIGTPHIAGYSTEGKVNGAVMLYDAVCRHLGITPTWSVEGKLPPPANPELTPTVTEPEATLRTIVRTAYNIMDDDVRLRAMAEWDPQRRAEHFKRLRSEYPVRREFPAIRVHLPSAPDAMRRTVVALGFSLSPT